MLLFGSFIRAAELQKAQSLMLIKHQRYQDRNHHLRLSFMETLLFLRRKDMWREREERREGEETDITLH